MKSSKGYKNWNGLGFVLLLLGGSLMIITLGLRAEYSILEIIIYTLLGLAVFAGGIICCKKYKDALEDHDMDFSKKFAVRIGSQPGETDVIRAFRSDYALFFEEKGISENSPVQNDTTQIYKNILDLQKRRLDKLGIKMQFALERRKYTDEPVRKKHIFDGKYEIEYFDEEVEARRRFTINGKRLFLRSEELLAHFTVLNAARVGSSDEIICPGCGHSSTRENLIDGCDFCGTKFTLEDLGSKVSGFSLQDRFDIAYMRFKARRWDYAKNTIRGIFLVLYFIYAFCMTFLLLDEGGIKDATNPLSWVLFTLFFAAIYAGVFTVPAALFYMFVIFPTLNLGASFKYNSKKKLNELKNAEDAENAFADRVRAADPGFSLADFKSNVLSRLSAVIFAENAAAAGAFSEQDLRSVISHYSQTFDYDIDSIVWKDYRVAEGLQQIELDASLHLYELKDQNVKRRKEHIKMKLIKDAKCRTQSVCAPFVMRCSGCGSSLSLSAGLVCEYCQSRVDLKKYDWVIGSYAVQ